MDILRKASLFIVAVCLGACHGGGGGKSSVDMSLLVGSWQQVSVKNVKNNVESTADENGYFQDPNSTSIKIKIIVTFDGSKSRMLKIPQNDGSSENVDNDYRVEGNAIIVISKTSEGPKEDRVSVISLTKDRLEVNDVVGNILKFKRVTTAQTQNTKTTGGGGAAAGPSASADAGLSVDKSLLVGSWQVVSIDDPPSNIEIGADEHGYLGLKTEGAIKYEKVFFTLNDSKMRILSIDRDNGMSKEEETNYRVEGNTFINISKDSNGSSREERSQIISLTKDGFEMKNEKGASGKVKRVTEAEIQSAKKSAAK